MSSTTPPEEFSLPETDSRFRSGTPVGVDVGKRNLLAVAPGRASSDLSEARIVHDSRIQYYYTLLVRRESVEGDAGHSLVEDLRRRLADVVEDALAHVESFDAPVLVLEDIGYPRRSLADCVEDGAQLDCWLFPAVQERLTEAAREAGIPVMETPEKYTTRQCHVCDQLTRVGKETVTCPTDVCPVGEVCRDRSAAATVAKRIL